MYYFSIFIFLSFFFCSSEILFSELSRKNQFSETLKKYKQKTKEKFLDPIELDIYKIKKELEIWENLEKKIQSFIESLKKFDHPIHSPFHKKVVLADSPHFNAKVVGKTLLEGKRKFKILQLAQSDKIRSNAFSLDKKFKSSVFYIHIADKKFKIDFPGGSLYDLYSYMQVKESQKYYYCYFLPLNTENKNILILEGVLTGMKNRISLSGDLNFLKEIGFLISTSPLKKTLKNKNKKDEKDPEEKLIDLKEEKKEVSFLNEKMDAQILSSIKVKKNTSVRSEDIAFDPASRKINYIEFFYKDLNEEKEKKSDSKISDSNSIGDSEVFEVADLDFETTPLRKYFDEYEKNNKKDLDEKKEKDEKSIFLNFLSKKDEKLLKEDLKISLSPSSRDWKKINFDIPQSLNLNIPDIHSIILNNKNEKEFDLKELSISFLKENETQKESLNKEDEIENAEDPYFNSEQSGSYNFIHKAHDSRISLDGLILKRNSNIISDIFPGIQLELNSKTMSEQEFIVKKDFNSIVDLIKNMIHKYNTLFIFLSNISDPFFDREEVEKNFLVKNDLKKWKEREKEFQKHSEENKEFLIYTGEAYRGYMDYEFMISHLKNKLHTLMLSSPFKEITEDKKIRFLSQIGIRTESFLTNSENLYSDIQSKKGLLHISEEILLKYLENFFYEIKAFFSYKNSKVSDLKEGFCIQMIHFLNPYIKSKKENNQFQESLIGSKKRIIKQKLRQKRLFFAKKETQVDKKTRKFEKDIKKANEYQNYYENKKDYYRQTFGAGQK